MPDPTPTTIAQDGLRAILRALTEGPVVIENGRCALCGDVFVVMEPVHVWVGREAPSKYPCSNCGSETVSAHWARHA